MDTTKRWFGVAFAVLAGIDVLAALVLGPALIMSASTIAQEGNSPEVTRLVLWVSSIGAVLVIGLPAAALLTWFLAKRRMTAMLLAIAPLVIGAIVMASASVMLANDHGRAGAGAPAVTMRR